MDLKYELVPYSDEIRSAYDELLPEQGREVAQGKLEWKFRSPPFGSGLIAVARSGSAILGLNAFMAGGFSLNGADVTGYQSMDTIVSPAARGQGVFGKLINCFYAEADAALLYGFPNLNSSPAFFGKLGWTHFGAVPMLARPLRSGFFKRFLRFMPDAPLPLSGKRRRDAVVIERFDEDATRLWREFSASIPCAVRRDAAFLNWRIAEHPSERYTSLRSRDGSLVIYKVVPKHGGTIGYLMEAIGPSGDLAALIREAMLRMRADGAEIAFAWCLPHSPNYRAHRKAGFCPFPERLRSIVINFGARALAGPAATIERRDGWYISYLDSDTV